MLYLKCNVKYLRKITHMHPCTHLFKDYTARYWFKWEYFKTSNCYKLNWPSSDRIPNHMIQLVWSMSISSVPKGRGNQPYQPWVTCDSQMQHAVFVHPKQQWSITCNNAYDWKWMKIMPFSHILQFTSHINWQMLHKLIINLS